MVRKRLQWAHGVVVGAMAHLGAVDLGEMAAIVLPFLQPVHHM